MNWEEIHNEALKCAADSIRSDTALIEVLIKVDRHKVYDRFNLKSTYAYCIQILKLDEEKTAASIRVARKSAEVPELKAAIQDGSISVYKAKKICSVLKPDNQEEWLAKAETLNTRDLEREVVKVNPREAVPDRIQPIADKWFALHCMLDSETQELLELAQDLESQRSSKAAAAGDAIKAALREYVSRHDPVKKAERIAKKKKPEAPAPASSKAAGKRTPVPASIAHAVRRRDEGRCTFVHPEHGRCNQRRWTQVHHIKEVSKGGRHSVDNLTTLCFAHHRQEHKSPHRALGQNKTSIGHVNGWNGKHQLLVT